MNEKQKEILEIIKTFIEENGYSPTVREISRLANIKSTSSVHRYIKKLKADGYITNGAELPRSIALTNKENSVKVIVNTIALMYEDNKEYSCKIHLLPSITDSSSIDISSLKHCQVMN